MGPRADPKERSKTLRENPDFEFDENAAGKIWVWGPETDGPNLFVDTTQGVQYINEIKEHVNSAVRSMFVDPSWMPVVPGNESDGYLSNF